MRVNAVSFFFLVVFFNDVLRVQGGWPSSMDPEDRKKMNGILEKQNIMVPDDLVLFAKYKTNKGRKLVKKWAKKSKFVKHVPKLKIIAFHPSNTTAVKALLRNRNIEYVEPEHKVKALPTTSPKASHKSRHLEESVGYGINMVQAKELWDLPIQPKITVCIIDSGYGLGHPDLPNLANNVTGISTGTGDWKTDKYGHGTHCAGVIGAMGENNIGAVGVMKDPDRFNFHIAKALDEVGDGSETDLLAAIEGCVDAGAKVISMSIGSPSHSETIDEACKDAYDDGILLVSAAGNEGNGDPSYPASYPYVMSVAAVGKDGAVDPYSQYNSQVEIAGPGVDIYSTVTSNEGTEFGYRYWTGTSMAAPFVAGVAAMVWSYFPECTNNQIRNVLLRTAKDAGDLGCDVDFGYGIVQAKAAYDLLDRYGCLAGGDLPSHLLPSDGAIGGCLQDPLYTPPPTPPPTEFQCSEKPFVLELKTDLWALETSWEIVNSENTVIVNGTGYRNNRSYVERSCLPEGEYRFQINDSGGDGICCKYGDGGYAIYFDGILKGSGGVFEDQESVKFGEYSKETHTKDPATTAPIVPPTAQPTPSPTDSPTRAPTPTPTRHPTEPPTGRPTEKPSFSPTRSPTRQPTASPTGFPTPRPTDAPTAPPTQHPTKQPTPQPTKSPTPPPTPDPTPGPSSAPTPSPTPGPTHAPTAPPTQNPTKEPTVFPTKSPSVPLTPEPTPAPTLLPSPTEESLRENLPLCKDDASWSTKKGAKTCSDLASDPSNLCTEWGKYNGKGKPVQASTACPLTCNTCPKGTARMNVPQAKASPTLPPSPAPTKRPTKQPTPSPTPMPTKSPTPNPTSSPTKSPTPNPTSSPTKSPTKPPVLKPAPAQSQQGTADPSRDNRPLCKDDGSWSLKDKGDTKTCSDLASDPSNLCTRWGKYNGKGKPVHASTACPLTCNTCPKGTRLPNGDLPCQDDDKWFHVNIKGKEKFCDYIAKRAQRCSMIGTARDNTTKEASEACPVACGTC